MTKQTGTIITVVVGILTFLCCTVPLCLFGIAIFAELIPWSSDVTSQTGPIEAAWGFAPCCLSILALVVPLLLWLFLVRGKENGTGDEIVGGDIAE